MLSFSLPLTATVIKKKCIYKTGQRSFHWLIKRSSHSELLDQVLKVAHRMTEEDYFLTTLLKQQQTVLLPPESCDLQY